MGVSSLTRHRHLGRVVCSFVESSYSFISNTYKKLLNSDLILYIVILHSATDSIIKIPIVNQLLVLQSCKMVAFMQLLVVVD